MDRQHWLSLIRSLALGAVGGALFSLTGLPLAWMLGPLVANLIAANRGMPVEIPERVRSGFLGVMGLVLGSQVTPELASQVSEWGLSALMLILGVAASTLAAAAWYRQRGFDGTTALFAAAPGAMTAMIIMGEESGGDPARIAIAQSLRVVLVILLLPPLFWAMEDPGTVVSEVATPYTGLWLLLAIAPVIWLGTLVRLPTPALLAPLLLAAVLSGFDLAHFSLTDNAMNVVLWVLGSSIGARFRGLTGAVFTRYLVDASVATVIALAVLALFAEAIHQLMGVPRDVAMLALAPGGIGEMAIVALALDLDPVFVAFHHLLRMVLLMFAAPLVARWIQRSQP
ncbi:AbrB family transcriptional regulator [Halomonas cupida]|uniref:Ammonia monooxygenase n=1 Tax=Halomonas cupida TaxID=44933 RepID=A0A1M6ZPI7_9GAMM|nr:AbrB family transcriptional regulator [Halomonas cupida]GEN22693.1 ammonia monooxygenase [Halomonas cupida]SHL32340.1 hypothetical protein SAMN05660971_00196 [Halomonas cupida]